MYIGSNKQCNLEVTSLESVNSMAPSSSNAHLDTADLHIGPTQWVLGRMND